MPARAAAGAAAELHGRAARWYAAHGLESTRCGTPSRPPTGTSRSRSWPGTGSSCSCTASAGAIRALVGQLPPERLAERTPSWPPRWPARRSTSATSTPPSGHLAHAELGAERVPSRGGARTWRRWRSRAWPRPAGGRLRGARWRRPTRCWPRPPGHDELADDARRALVHALLGRSGAVGAPARSRRRGADDGRLAGRRPRGWTTSRSCALSDLALLDVMVHGPAGDRRHAHDAIAARRAARLVAHPADRVRARGARAVGVLRPAHERGRRAAGARPGRRRAHCTCASCTSSSSTSRRACRRARPSRARACARSTRYEVAPPPRDAAAVRARLARHDAFAAAGRRRASCPRPARRWRRVRDEPWLRDRRDVRAAALAGGEPAEAAEHAGGRASRGQAGDARRRQRRARTLLAVACDEAGEPGRAGNALEAALELAETTGHRWPFIELGRRMDALLRRQIRSRHGASRRRRRAAGRVRRPRARAPCRRAAAGAAERPRAGDPALPADVALQPRDRGGAVRHDQHGQDAPALDLPQARRRPPARGSRARARPTAPQRWSRRR